MGAARAASPRDAMPSGLLASGTIALAATWLAQHYNAPVILGRGEVCRLRSAATRFMTPALEADGPPIQSIVAIAIPLCV